MIIKNKIFPTPFPVGSNNDDSSMTVYVQFGHIIEVLGRKHTYSRKI
jgi:hypothetical protein